MHVSYEQAEMAIAAAITESKKLGTQMCIAVVDSGADLKAFTRMNGAWVGSIDIAIKKAKTAVFFWHEYRANRPVIATRRAALRYRAFQPGSDYFSRRCAYY